MEIPLKFFRENKKYHQKILKRRLIYNFISHGVITTKGREETLNVETIFEKSHRSSVILKIVGATPQLVQNLTPIRKLFCTFLY